MRKHIALFEIALMVCATFAFIYMIREASEGFSGVNQEENNFVKGARAALLNYFDDNLVSAVDGIWTCLKDNQGSVCQEYPASTCNGVCNSTCFPGKREVYSECALGTCIDPTEGTCAPQTPRASCTQLGGTWKAQGAQELAECRPGCCVTGNEAQYITEKACNVQSARLGVPKEFRPVANELECLGLANRQAQGACVFGTEEVSCKFIVKEECLAQGGSFNEGLLCSHPSLNTGCEKQKTTSCFAGKDEVYWVDSCGNRENIFDANRVRSWNDGKILAKDSSCSLGIGNNLFASQSSCGNCNYFTGSVCGTKRAQDAAPSVGNNVCRDLTCVDENGKKRKNGESWCVFNSQIGVDGIGNARRTVDVPGSRHMRNVCLNGEVRNEPCADFRSEICVEQRDEAAQFSQAACRINQWQKCADANTDAEKLAKCEETTDCVLKEVNIDTQFKFNRCVPRYPPGFDLGASNGGEVGQSLCSLGSQKCTIVKVKKLFGSKTTNANCGTTAFAEGMNNLWMSLGDCGASVNIVGDVSDQGYKVINAPKVRDVYKNALKLYATPKAGQKVAQLSDQELAQLFGLDVSDPNVNVKDKLGKMIGLFGAGASGAVALAYIYSIGWGAFYSALLSPGGINFSVGAWGPVGNGFANVAGGAAVGAAIGFLVAKLMGLKGDAVLGTVIVGFVAGAALAAYGSFGAGTILGQSVAFLSFGFFFWTIVIVVVFALIMKFLGIGKVKKTVVEFQCLAWQPPRGGDKCSQCGTKGIPCSKYQCQSLGQTCEIVNEGTGQEACVDVAPNDALAPIISPNYNALLAGFSYTNVNERGYTLASGGGCVPAYTPVTFGVALNEKGQCKIDTEHTASFEDMEFYFGNTNLYKGNHTQIFSVPTLEALANILNQSGEYGEALPQLNVNQRRDVTFYVRCADKAGNANIQEYAINFCLAPGADRTAPIISSFTPASPAYAAFNAVSQQTTFYTNEPAECKWSIQNKDYSLMENTAPCMNDVEDGTLLGWQCNATLPVTGENKYYFRCKDQPFLTNGTRNTNAQSTEYVIRRSQSALTISSVGPNGTVSTGGLPANIDLKVTTTGGAAGANRFCEFSFNNLYSRFFESGTDNHKQELNLFEARNYHIPIRCYDDAGNTANAAIQFNLLVDSVGPFITRVYRQNGLTVVTNEPSSCVYSQQSCSFIFENGTLMSGQDYVHTTPFEGIKTYFVKCRDGFGNPGTCAAVKGGVI